MRTTTNVELTRTERDNLLAAALVHAAAELRHAADQFGLARGYFDPVVLEDAGKAACDAREALDALGALGFGEES
jgi:hypothetical protein